MFCLTLLCSEECTTDLLGKPGWQTVVLGNVSILESFHHLGPWMSAKTGLHSNWPEKVQKLTNFLFDSNIKVPLATRTNLNSGRTTAQVCSCRDIYYMTSHTVSTEAASRRWRKILSFTNSAAAQPEQNYRKRNWSVLPCILRNLSGLGVMTFPNCMQHSLSLMKHGS